jgi:hypothetical protein
VSDGVPLSDIEWEVLTVLEMQLDLEGPALPAPEVVTFCLQLWAWLRWFLDPSFEGLPMPKLLLRGA